ncbi:MAG: glycoside hydrolase family protein [Planctomycetota bacterium]
MTATDVPLSEFCRSLEPVGRILEDPEYNVWGCSPIYDDDGRVHVFFARWKNVYHHEGWVTACEVGHAVSREPDRPGGPYDVLKPALVPAGNPESEGGQGNDDAWDADSIHNPTVHRVGDQFVLFYMGATCRPAGCTRDMLVGMSRDEVKPYFHRTVATKRIGMAIADSLNGPWRRVSDQPILTVGADGAWDDYVVSNPAFCPTPDGSFRLYYKGWNRSDNDRGHSNRKYGFAEATELTGPYTKHNTNPVIDFSHLHEDMQCEDAYLWHGDGHYHAVLRDMGFYNQEYGLKFKSRDGIAWGDPEVAFLDAPSYFNEAMPGLDREGRFERPQLLMRDGRPEYLFCAYRGGRYNTSSGVVLRVNRDRLGDIA